MAFRAMVRNPFRCFLIILSIGFPFAISSVLFSFEGVAEQTILYGLNPGSGMWRIMDNCGNYYDPPGRGIILNKRTADQLHVEEGDRVWISSPGITVDDVEVTVSHVIEESFGSSCYMSMEGITAAFPVEEMANTVLLTAEPGEKEAIKEQVQRAGRVTWLVDARKIIGSYRDMMGSMLAMIYMFAILSAAAGILCVLEIGFSSLGGTKAEAVSVAAGM